MKAFHFATAFGGMALLIVGSPLFAQPWQWQLFENDYYNPTGFPHVQHHSGYSIEVIGDFSGNGRDDFLHLAGSGFTIAERDSARFYWTALQSEQDLSDGWMTGAFAMNLDEDTAEELIVYGDSAHVWKAVSYDPWVWEQRDDLLTDLYFPSQTLKAIFGDYDSDGLLNGVLLAE